MLTQLKCPINQLRLHYYFKINQLHFFLKGIFFSISDDISEL